MADDFLTSLSQIAAATLVVAGAGAVPVASLWSAGNSVDPCALDPVRGVDPYLQLTAALVEASVAVKLSGTDPKWVVKYLGVAVVVIQTLEYLNGFGPPDHGDEFRTGSAQIDGMYNLLKNADPDPSQWSGLVADIYKKLNKGLRQLVHAMSLADDGVVQILMIQSAAVEGARDLLALYRIALVAAIAIAQACCRTYDQMVAAGQYETAAAAAASCRRYGYGVASAVVGAAWAVLGVLAGVGAEIAHRIKDVKEQIYQNVVDAVDAVIHELLTGIAGSSTAAVTVPELPEAASPQATQTVFTLQNARMPWPASSRP